MTTEQENAVKVELFTTHIRRLRDLRALLKTVGSEEMVFAWSQYSLGVKTGIDGKNSRTVGIEDATVFVRRPDMTFHNGADEPALFVRRSGAICEAIHNTEGVLFSMVEAFDAKKKS